MYQATFPAHVIQSGTPVLDAAAAAELGGLVAYRGHPRSTRAENKSVRAWANRKWASSRKPVI